MTTFADIKANAKLPQKTVELCLRGDLQAEYEGLERELKRARAAVSGTLAPNEDVKTLEEMMANLRDQMSASVQVFTMRGLSKKKFRDLITKYPPRDQDRMNGLGHNAETFPVPLVQACCIDPVMTVMEVEELCDELLTQGQWDALFITAFLLNRDDIEVPT